MGAFDKSDSPKKPPRLSTFCVFLNESRDREFVDFRLAADHSDNNQRTLKTIYLGNRCSIRLGYWTKRSWAHELMSL